MIQRLAPAQWNLLIAAILVVGAGLIIAGRVPDGPPAQGAAAPISAASESDPAPAVGHPAPEFTLVDLDGRMVALRELRGKVVLVNVWATWCPPCRAEMPAMQAALDRYGEQGLVVLAVNQREDREAVAAFMRERQLAFPALLDSDGAVGAAYQASALPSSFFIGRDGMVRAVYRGPLSRSVLESTIAGLVAEP
jgi:cytochrome c biogenesis protein CcmG, thiol:disulfide interchange protein DsbE